MADKNQNLKPMGVALSLISAYNRLKNIDPESNLLKYVQSISDVDFEYDPTHAADFAQRFGTDTEGRKRNDLETTLAYSKLINKVADRLDALGKLAEEKANKMTRIRDRNGLIRIEEGTLVSVVTETEHDGGQVSRKLCVGVLEKRGARTFTTIQRLIDGKTNALGRVYYRILEDDSKVIQIGAFPLSQDTPSYQEHERKLAEVGE